jgi:allantoin racemase
MLLACTLGAKFSMLTGLPAEIPVLYELISKYGLEKRLASIIPVHMDTSTIIHGEKDLLIHNITAGRKAIEEDLAEVLVIAGSVVAGIAQPLQKELGIPVVPGLVAAVKLCEDLVEMDLWTSQVYKYYSIHKKDKLYGYEDFQDVFSQK